jgi:hypothetical protein
MLILELDIAPDGKGSNGLWITAAKSYMDPAKVANKAKAVLSK